MLALMCLHVWYVCRYIGSLLKQHSRCLWNPGKVFILCHSLICSGSEPFRPEEQLLFAEGEIFLVPNLATLLGNSTYISWYDLPQFLNSCLNPGSISNSLQSDLPCDLVNFGLKFLYLNNFYFICSFLLSIHQYFPWSDQFLTWFFVLLVFFIYSGNRTCVVGNKQCHLMYSVSHKRCHRLSPII